LADESIRIFAATQNFRVGASASRTSRRAIFGGASMEDGGYFAGHLPKLEPNQQMSDI
jgi:hypothetical protein